MKSFNKAKEKGKEEFVKSFPIQRETVKGEILHYEVRSVTADPDDIKTFLDSYANDIRKAVLEEWFFDVPR